MGNDDSSGNTDVLSSDWRFLIDENLSPAIATELERHGITAEYVLDTLFEGANDFTDILPYCRKTETVLVTNNVLDFNSTDLSSKDHAGIVIVYNKDRPATEIADELQQIVATYPTRNALQGFECADHWADE